MLLKENLIGSWMIRQFPLFLLSLLALVVCFGCQRNTDQASTEEPVNESQNVICVAWPLREMVLAMAGDSLKVEIPEPASGLSWRNRREFFPDDDQLALLANAKLVVDNGPGVPYVNWFGMSAVAEDRVCNASVNFRLDDYIPIKDYHSVHSHGPEGEHSHDYLVPYCWHDPSLAAKQALAILKSLTTKWPELESSIAGRASDLQMALALLAESLKSVGSGISADTEVVLATPDLMFLSRAMGLKARYELWFDDVEGETWKTRFRSLRTSGTESTKLVLLWPGTASEIVRQSAGDSITLIEVDMLESANIEGTFLARFRQLVEKLGRDLPK